MTAVADAGAPARAGAAPPEAGVLREDLALIVEMVPPRARVLDVGCGDGRLLEVLARLKGVDGRGIEISQPRVSACVARGLPVIQGDAEADLPLYPDDAFDYVILSRTIQATRQPRAALEELLRVGRKVIVSFPNFGHWRIRAKLLLGGRMPVTQRLDQPWFETDNIHLCTIADFTDLCALVGARVVRAFAIHAAPQGRRREASPFTPPSALANWMAEEAVFLLERA